ncbi:hypothetical protein Tcan_16194 [Toxocara canis]|uniref:Uncharacterized protein n=1 Tax=Toxocara canis TaxID=6265 RepID=A0A0B2V8J7_TOXCA|nr:hypothetical protein Tcan_16194 [Toxocara canis]
MYELLLGITTGGEEMFALVYFPTLRNHAVVDLRELSTANAEGDQVFLDLGGGQRMPIDVIGIGAKNDMLQLKRTHLINRSPASSGPAKRARMEENGESRESNGAEDRPGSSSEDVIVCSCSNPDDSTEMQRLRSDVVQLRTDLDNVLAALGIKQRFTPAVLMPEDERFTPDDIDYSYVSKTDVVLTVRKSRSVTAFARQMARKLFTSGADKTARMRDKMDKDKVEWLRRVCCAYYPTAEWPQQCAQWAACMRAIDNYTVWFQNRSAIGNNQSVLAGLASLRGELAHWNNWNNGAQGDSVKDEPADVDASSFNVAPADEGASSFNITPSGASFNMTVTVNENGEVIVPS